VAAVHQPTCLHTHRAERAAQNFYNHYLEKAVRAADLRLLYVLPGL